MKAESIVSKTEVRRAKLHGMIDQLTQLCKDAAHPDDLGELFNDVMAFHDKTLEMQLQLEARSTVLLPDLQVPVGLRCRSASATLVSEGSFTYLKPTEANRGGGIQRENMTVQRNPPVNTCATPPRDGRDGSPVGVTNKPARQSCSLQKHMLNAQYVVIVIKF
ncbi:hypothetical protein T12_11598 [Trichinella patagoniensis]|uniref:Uncharacterized protein n=1 Tax=Trichinella patagoniensis TaxID=990121 RepID=A0A0V0Z5L1_9BILA|nr:hypothetical protein T12_11598 [Trichinella patagoniensis]